MTAVDVDRRDRLVTLAGELGRDDLADRVRTAAVRARRAGALAVVIGEFKQGKSSLVNGLVGSPICPVDDDLATSALTVVHHADPVEVVVHRRVDGELQRTRIALTDLAGVVTEHGNPDNELGVERVDVGVPSGLLRAGITLVDSPGAGGLGAGHAATTLAFLPLADAVLFVSDATSELSAPELDYLLEAHQRCETVVLCQTKTDLFPAWRRIVERNRAHLAARGIDVPIVAVSSVLRAEALRAGDAALNDESGYPALLAVFEREVLGRARQAAQTRADAEAEDAREQLAVVVDAELVALRDPNAGARAAAAAQVARERLDEVRAAGSRWSQVMADRFGELSNAVTFELRESQREISRRSEERLDAQHDGWDEVLRSVQTEVAEGIAGLYAHIGDGAADIVCAVSELLADELGVAVPVAVMPASLDELLAAGSPPSAAEPASVAKTAAAGFGRALVALRGMQSGIMLLGLVGTLLPAVAVATPIVLGVGSAFGVKTVLDTRKRKVAEARQQVRVAIRRLLDDVAFRIGNDVTVTLRRVQTQLRDDIGARLAELQRTTADIATQATAAAKQLESGRDDRIERVAALAAELEGLRS